ncbi:hypothetical protein [Dactylosporangium sp. CA-233914]|uniref:hypothetical protein n=1 Tax=Dactylosporangium sp. CA-233914 TaxID=3239934 RepID=UPI003D8C8BE0
MTVDIAVVTAAPALLRVLSSDRETVHHPGGTAVIVHIGSLLVAVEPPSSPTSALDARHRLFVGLAQGFPPVRPGDVLVPSKVVGRPEYRPDAQLLALARATQADDWIPDRFAHSPAVHFGPMAIGTSDPQADGAALMVLGAVDARSDPVLRADAADAAAEFTLALLHRLAEQPFT